MRRGIYAVRSRDWPELYDNNSIRPAAATADAADAADAGMFVRVRIAYFSTWYLRVDRIFQEPNLLLGEVNIDFPEQHSLGFLSIDNSIIIRP